MYVRTYVGLLYVSGHITWCSARTFTTAPLVPQNPAACTSPIDVKVFKNKKWNKRTVTTRSHRWVTAEPEPVADATMLLPHVASKKRSNERRSGMQHLIPTQNSLLKLGDPNIPQPLNLWKSPFFIIQPIVWSASPQQNDQHQTWTLFAFPPGAASNLKPFRAAKSTGAIWDFKNRRPNSIKYNQTRWENRNNSTNAY